MDRVELAVEQWRRERPELELLPMETVARLTTAAALDRESAAPGKSV